VKTARADQRVDLRDRQLRHLRRRRRSFDELDGRGQTDLIACADGDDARDELLEHALEPALGQLEHGCVGMLRHRFANATEHGVDVERRFRCHAGIERRNGDG
jgi:hypothetical protein